MIYEGYILHLCIMKASLKQNKFIEFYGQSQFVFGQSLYTGNKNNHSIRVRKLYGLSVNRIRKCTQKYRMEFVIFPLHIKLITW